MLKSLSCEFNHQAIYLNSATVGLACNGSIKAMQTDMQDWVNGTMNPKEYDQIVNRCRELFATLVEANSDEVAIANQVSTSVAMLAASLPSGTKILAPEEDFTSVLFPFLAQELRGIEVTLVPLEALIDSISTDFDWVACSITQSSNGKVTDLSQLSKAAKLANCKVLLDGTQSVGWMPIKRDHWDMLVCGAYKWLMSPRGTAFAAIKPDISAQITPINANWYAGESPWDSIYGSPLRLATSARKFDISPAWLNWVGTLPALELITSIGIDAIYEHNTGLANLFCQRMGLPEADSAIVSIEGIKDETKLKTAGVIASVRDEALRLSFHLYNNESDVNSVVKAIG